MANFPSNSWLPFFQRSKDLGLFDGLSAKIKQDKLEGKVIYPTSSAIFKAFELCDFTNLKVVLLGQDPYHGEGEANGLCFSVHNEVRNPPSLKNIFKELKNEFPDFNLERSSDLSDWAEQGVLLINSVLTVEKDKPASHSGYGWQVITDNVISEISDKKEFVVFILLGNFAKSKIPLIDERKHQIIQAAHPSPFSAHRGFLGSNVFLKCNQALQNKSMKVIRW